MKLAHFILAHSKPNQLRRLVKRLEHPDVFVFIHVDKKADWQSFNRALSDCDRVIFVQKRVDIIWGSYRMVEATVFGFQEILAYPIQFDYINILSGQDYPIQSAETFVQFLRNNPGKAFMQSEAIDGEWTEAIPRIARYHFVNVRLPGKYQLEKYVNQIMPVRKMPDGLVGVGRSQWFMFTPIHAAYCIAQLEAKPSLRRFFRLTWGSDEFVFQTLLHNSSFRSDMINKNYRYVDWSEKKPNPKTLREEDFSLIRTSGAFFARKFDEENLVEVLNQIDKELLHWT